LSAERRFDVSVGAFVAACLALMVAAPRFQTVPFHWIWIGLTLLAGVRLWPVRQTWIVVALVAATTAATMLIPGGAGASAVEMTEIPLMAAVYLTMVWHARRREQALARADRSAQHQREFVRDAAHSLRTPLTIARGHLELVGQRLPAGAGPRGHRGRARRAAAAVDDVGRPAAALHGGRPALSHAPAA
jgi:signal transduction histidine kinase